MEDKMCEKLLLADSLGIRLIYCRDCNVVELEIGAISLRLNPDVMQQVANIMMKASLQLDQIETINRAMKSSEARQSVRLQMTH